MRKIRQGYTAVINPLSTHSTITTPTTTTTQVHTSAPSPAL